MMVSKWKRMQPWLAPLQSAACTYRIALGHRTGQKVLVLKTAPTQNLEQQSDQEYCANTHGFSLYAGVRCAMSQRKELEHLCCYITRPAIVNERLAALIPGSLRTSAPRRTAGIRSYFNEPFSVEVRNVVTSPHQGVAGS